MFGAWLNMTDVTVAEIIATSGLDYVLIDAEHAPIGIEALRTMLVAFNGVATVPIVRVAWNDPVRIKQALDAGVEGVLAPMVRTVDEARALVAASRYPPLGWRGFGPHRASSYYREAAAYAERANDAILVIPQLEHVDAAEAVEDIIAVPGVDALCIGPNDLSGTAGAFLQTDHAAVQSALERILGAAKAAGIGVCPGIPIGVQEQTWWVERGARMLLIGSDIGWLTEGARRDLDAARKAFGP